MTKTDAMASLDWKEQIAEFRLKFKDSFIFELEDHVFWAFLTVCNCDQNKAKVLLQKYLEVTFILTGVNLVSYKDYVPLDEVVRNLKYAFLGRDEIGRPVLCCMIGSWDPKELIGKGMRNELFMSALKIADEICRLLYKENIQGGYPTGAVVFADLKGMSIRRFWHFETVRLILGMSGLLRELEPLASLVSKAYIVNCPWGYYHILNLVKPIISRTTLAKIEILSSDEKKWKECLRKNFPIDILPQEYGGTRESVWT